jgi:uncharacterized protein (DUF362 family)
MNNNISRRTFMRISAFGAAAFALSGHITKARINEESAKVIVVKGTNEGEMLKKGVQALGGWQKFVKKQQKVVIKPNIAWVSTPEQGGDTSPELVKQCILQTKEAGADSIIIPEHSCAPHARTFPTSGIQQVAEETQTHLYAPENKDYEQVSIPTAKILKQVDVVKDVLNAPCLINMPVAKDHSAAVLTLGMKNWMGSVKDRGYWHRNGLHQCIADFSSLIKPGLIVIDATRIMVSSGPNPPGKLEYPHKLILGTDPVAVDAVASTLFNKNPLDIHYIRIADNMGIGCGDLDKIKIIEL